MKRFTQVAGALIVAAATVACGGNATDDRAANAPRAGEGAVGTSGVTGADRDFVADQLEDGQAEIELGRLAQERATNPRVKEFAAMMVSDHTRAGEELRRLAGSGAAQAPAAEEKNRDHKSLREDLAKLNGAEFDREYMEAMVKEHKEAVDEVKDKAENSQNTDVKQWAAKTLPSLQQHLEQAQQIHESLDRNKK